jgi:hypothetical protein
MQDCPNYELVRQREREREKEREEREQDRLRARDRDRDDAESRAKRRRSAGESLEHVTDTGTGGGSVSGGKRGHGRSVSMGGSLGETLVDFEARVRSEKPKIYCFNCGLQGHLGKVKKKELFF